jgi:hypothetical protein
MAVIVFTDGAVTAERRRSTLASDVEETLLHHVDETRNYILPGKLIYGRTREERII